MKAVIFFILFFLLFLGYVKKRNGKRFVFIARNVMTQEDRDRNYNAADGYMDTRNEKRREETEQHENDDGAPDMGADDGYDRKENI